MTRSLLRCPVILGLVLSVPAYAQDLDQMIFIASDSGSAGGAATLLAVDAAAPDSVLVEAAPGIAGLVSGLALDPIDGVLYARQVDGAFIYAFDARTLARLPGLDLVSPTVNGGALEIDPFRRIVYAAEGTDTVVAWSIAVS